MKICEYKVTTHLPRKKNSFRLSQSLADEFNLRIIFMKWSSISLFSSQRKKCSAKNIFVILSSVSNSTLKLAQMKMSFIAMIMVMIMIRIVRKKSMRKLINPNKLLNLSLYRHLYLGAWYCNRASLFCANNWKRCCRRWYFWSLRSLYHQGQKVLSRTVLETSLFKKFKDQTVFYPVG